MQWPTESYRLPLSKSSNGKKLLIARTLMLTLYDTDTSTFFLSTRSFRYMVRWKLWKVCYVEKWEEKKWWSMLAHHWYCMQIMRSLINSDELGEKRKVFSESSQSGNNRLGLVECGSWGYLKSLYPSPGWDAGMLQATPTPLPRLKVVLNSWVES